MAGSLKTAFFNLVKYAANDITSWLTDFNGNMDKIDAAMNQNKTAAQTAQDAVDNLESEYESLLQVVNGHTTSIDANEKAIAANSSEISELKKDLINPIVITNIEPLKSGAAIDPKSYIAKLAERIYNATIIGNTSATTINNISMGSGEYISPLCFISGNPFSISGKTDFILTAVLVESTVSQYKGVIAFYNSGVNQTVIGYPVATAQTVYSESNLVIIL